MSVAVRNVNAPASPAQFDLIDNLLVQRSVPWETVDSLEDFRNSGMTKGQASETIDKLFGFPFKTRAQNSDPVTEPGFYEHDGVIYHVQWNQSKTNLYAKKNTGRWEYAKGAMAFLHASEKIDLARAESLSLAWGRCIRCNKTLTRTQSVQRGMGDICASYFA
jgi:hypothetical protein